MLLTLEGRVTFTLKLGVHSTLCRGGVLLTLEAGVVFMGFTIYTVQLSCLIPCTHEDAVAAGGTVQQQTSYYSVLITVLQCVGG